MEEVQYYKEQLSSLKDMFSRTTEHMQKLQNELINAKNHLEATNLSLNQSIAYAEKIQNHLLPTNYSNCAFSELYFDVIQRDQIGGDFVFITEDDNRIYFAIMDCTGHGIPGSLLTMMGYNFLNEAINPNSNQTANQILKKLDEKFQLFFKTKEGKTQLHDGMDGVLCIYDTQSGILQYSMAGRPFWAKINKQWFKQRPDRNSIGGHSISDFEIHEIKIEKGDEIFLFSDGLTDQFGGENNKKFLTKRLFAHLNDDNFINLKDKVDALMLKLKEWQGDEEQTDDMAYLAIKF